MPHAAESFNRQRKSPWVLVTTDALSEGIDLHTRCRHLVHYEVNPSPVRTLQRIGRVRRLGSWASRSSLPIRIAYWAMPGTRDALAVEATDKRLRRVHLLLGGIGDALPEIRKDEDLRHQVLDKLEQLEDLAKRSLRSGRKSRHG